MTLKLGYVWLGLGRYRFSKSIKKSFETPNNNRKEAFAKRNSDQTFTNTG